jgi:hypothetical protein
MYIKNLNNIVSDKRQLKALIWLTKEEFYFLSSLWWEIEQEIKEDEYQKRLKNNNWKAVRIGSNSGNTKIKTSEDKLFLILYYMKTYPTFDVLWFHFWLSRWWACQNIHKILPILQRLLEKIWIAPKRKLETSEDLKNAFWWDILDLILDWTERRHFRHKKYSEQEKNYSGKKNVGLKRTQ